MQEKLLKKIIQEFAGPSSEKLVDILYNKQNVNEFLIAKKMDLTINQTRNMLYKLADQGLVGFIRKKDKKKGGWYTYFWTLRVKKSLQRYREDIIQNIKAMQHQLHTRQSTRHYYCKNCDLEYNEEDAMANEFTCTECGEVLQLRETEEISSRLKNEIKRLEDSLIEIDQQIKILEQKEQKSLERKLKLEKKIKDDERRARRKEKEKEKLKLEKQTKKAKKKVKSKKKKKKVKKKPKKKTKKKAKSKTKKKKVKTKSPKHKPKKFSKKRKKR